MKPQVYYLILEDMQKNIKDFKPTDYEPSEGYSEPTVIEKVQKYYDEHLPVDVTAWLRVNEPDRNLFYASELDTQVRLVRDYICSLLYSSYEERISNPPLVISTYCSESVKLPVYQINLKRYGIEMVFRNNFYDWKISVKSKKPLNFDFMGLFDASKEWNDCFCDDFPEDKVYGSYSSNFTCFTIVINTHYEFYTFATLLSHYLGIR